MGWVQLPATCREVKKFFWPLVADTAASWFRNGTLARSSIDWRPRAPSGAVDSGALRFEEKARDDARALVVK